MRHQPAQTLFLLQRTQRCICFACPFFSLFTQSGSAMKLAAHGGALDTSIEKLLLPKSGSLSRPPRKWGDRYTDALRCRT